MATDLRFPAWMDDVVARERARDAVAELVTALEALPALWLRLDEWTHGIREERAEWLRTFLVATQNAQALLDRLRASVQPHQPPTARP